jgi:hypothetical protein
MKKSKLGPLGYIKQDTFTSDDDTNVAGSSKAPYFLNEEDEDGDFIPHNEEGSDEEYELGEIEKEELIELYKDQNKSPELFTRPSFHMMTRGQKVDHLKEQSEMWTKRVRCLGYGLGMISLAIVFVGLCITGYARNKNGYCQNFPQPLMKISTVLCI